MCVVHIDDGAVGDEDAFPLGMFSMLTPDADGYTFTQYAHGGQNSRNQAYPIAKSNRQADLPPWLADWRARARLFCPRCPLLISCP